MTTNGSSEGDGGREHRGRPGIAHADPDLGDHETPRALQEHWDGLVAAMQTPAHRKGVDALFAATPKELGAAAARAARAPAGAGRTKK